LSHRFFRATADPDREVAEESRQKVFMPRVMKTVELKLAEDLA
jgi:hypothetical protein